MVKFCENLVLFNFTWEQVAQGFWMRYPNPYSTHVLTEDTIYREVRDNKLYTKRHLTKTNRVPKWGERFIKSAKVGIIEESIVDPQTKTLTTYTRNLGYSKVMSVVEKVVYTVSEEDPNCTIAVRSGWIDSNVFGFKHPIQVFGLERFRKNCDQMVRGFNHVLCKLFPNQNGSEEPSVRSLDWTSVYDAKVRIKDAAKRASEIAKTKATPLTASCQD